MTDEVWKRAEIESPCVKICVIHPETRLCVGCHRSGDEISRWSRLSPAERQTIMQELPARAKAQTHRRGGRKARLAKGSDPDAATVIFAPKDT